MAGSSPFTVLEDSFRLLDAGLHPLALDGRQLGAGLPARQIPISELRSLVMSSTATHELQDQVVGAVIERLQQEHIPWVAVLGGLLLPGMRHLAVQMAPRGRRASRRHAEVELLTRLLAATHRSPSDLRSFAMHLLNLLQE
jgi:hypothetical protein